MSNIIKEGFLVTHLDPDPKTYACLNRRALDDLILHLTGRDASTFPISKFNSLLPNVPKVSIAPGLHIYT